MSTVHADINSLEDVMRWNEVSLDEAKARYDQICKTASEEVQRAEKELQATEEAVKAVENEIEQLKEEIDALSKEISDLDAEATSAHLDGRESTESSASALAAALGKQREVVEENLKTFTETHKELSDNAYQCRYARDEAQQRLSYAETTLKSEYNSFEQRVVEQNTKLKQEHDLILNK